MIPSNLSSSALAEPTSSSSTTSSTTFQIQKEHFPLRTSIEGRRMREGSPSLRFSSLLGWFILRVHPSTLAPSPPLRCVCWWSWVSHKRSWFCSCSWTQTCPSVECCSILVGVEPYRQLRLHKDSSQIHPCFFKHLCITNMAEHVIEDTCCQIVYRLTHPLLPC